MGTAAMGDPTGARDLSVPLVLVAQHPTVQREHWLLSMTVAPGASAAHVRVCVHVCAWTCVCMLCCRSEGKGSLLSGVWGTR